MLLPRRPLSALTLGVLALSLAACAPSGVGALGEGFADTPTPAPESTISPEPGSWDGVQPPAGYRVVLLTPEYESSSEALAAGVEAWAAEQGVGLERVGVSTPDQAVDGIVEAMDLDADLIVATGPALVDPLALVTASHLDEQFLVLGAQLPEPTVNVTAAIWDGAASRGSEVSESDATHAAAAYTSERAGSAVRAGVASVLHGLTGIVVQLP